MIQVRFRPLDERDWPAHGHVYRPSPFSAAWSDTLWILDRELRALEADNVTVQIAVRDSMIRRDGWPQDRAVAANPKAVLSFDSKHGPGLVYGTAAFTSWRDNLRAIALALDSLRRVDRYEVGEVGAQYRGYRELPAAGESTATRGDELITEHGGVTAAIKATHPDRGGEPADFRAVMAASGGRG